MTIGPAVNAVAGHVLAVFLIVVAPILAWRHAHRRDAQAPGARLRRYRLLVLRQAGLSAVILAFCVVGEIPARQLGLGAPVPWWLTAGASAAVAALFLQSARRLRRRAPELRDALRQRGGELLLPESRPEVWWFVAVSLGSGISEELGYRGFLFYYLRTNVPSLDVVALVLVTSACFWPRAHLSGTPRRGGDVARWRDHGRAVRREPQPAASDRRARDGQRARGPDLLA